MEEKFNLQYVEYDLYEKLNDKYVANAFLFLYDTHKRGFKKIFQSNLRDYLKLESRDKLRKVIRIFKFAYLLRKQSERTTNDFNQTDYKHEITDIGIEWYFKPLYVCKAKEVAGYSKEPISQTSPPPPAPISEEVKDDVPTSN